MLQKKFCRWLKGALAMTEDNGTRMGLTREDVQTCGDGGGIEGLLRAMGDSDADAGAIAASEDGRVIGERMSLMAMGEDSEASRSFWLHCEKGLLKELHGEGLDKWASYIPTAAQHAPERKFPLIFCLHGAHNPIQLTESYGVIQVAAREECIVIAPENENWNSIAGLLDYAKQHFPVDERRVYSIGYSFGGFMSSRNVLAHPEVFAGVGMGGMLFAGCCPGHYLDEQWYDEYELTEEMLAKAERMGIPAVLFMGENEMLRLLPLWREPKGEVRDGVIPLSSADKRNSYNNWRRAGRCAPAKFWGKGEGADEVERSIGVGFEHTQVCKYRGRKYFIGDCVNPEGECLLRTIACEKMVHWPTASFAELVWEHIGKFARDTETGELIRLQTVL